MTSDQKCTPQVLARTRTTLHTPQEVMKADSGVKIIRKTPNPAPRRA